MAKRVFKTDLSVKGIENLKKELMNYRDNELPKKLDLLVKKLAESGIPTIESRMAQASYSYDEKGIESGADTTHNTYVKVDSLIGLSKATLVLQGKEVLFIEFGAGVAYNGSVGSSPHPLGSQYGFLIGSYGMGNGSKQVWGYYADSGELVLTRGTKATMPMYSADLEIINNVVAIAKGVFS
jgi:hypothetical protein